MKGVVVVGVVPVDHPWRHIALLERRGQALDCLGRRGAHLGILAVELAVRGDEVFPAIGDHERVEGGDRVDAVRGQLIAIGVDIARPLLAEIVLHRHEKIEERIPLVGDIGDFEARLLDQGSPDMEWPAGDPQWHDVVAALFGGPIVEKAGIHRDRGIIRFLRLDDVADVEELVVPRLQ